MDALRRIPSVDQILHAPALRDVLALEPRPVVLRIVREHLDGIRAWILADANGPDAVAALDLASMATEIARRVRDRPRGPRRVLNATGVVLHTNLGRARLAEAARRALDEVARGACDLELDLESGQRASRERHLEGKLVAVTGAEAAFVVNNNAGALVLCVNELGQGKEIVVSRGELVEIGGSFRLPDVLARSGARLVEVGTTNRTRLADYAQAIGPATAAFLKVHRSNFRQRGFVEEPGLDELVRLGGEHGIPVVHDLGSGALFEIEGTPHEPKISESLAAGTDLVTLSGDKLLGGPQAGIVLGKAAWVSRIRKNPLARALRVDKFTIAALAATLDLLEDEQRARASIPTLRALRWTQGDLAPRATRIAGALGACAALRVRVTSSWSEVGGGAAPEEGLATTVVALTHESFDAEHLALELRRARVPVVGRIVQNEVLLDPRTLDPEEDDELVQAILDRLDRPGG